MAETATLTRIDFVGAGLVFGQELEVGARRLVAAAEPVGLVAVVFDLLALAHDAVVVEGPGIARGEIEIAFLGPAVDQVKAGDGGVVLDAHMRPDQLEALAAQEVLQVGHNARLIALGKGEAHHADAFAGSQFHGDIVVEQLDLVVTGGGRFLVMRIAGPVAAVGVLLGAGHQLWLADLWHEQEVAQVGDARAVQVGQAEAHDRGVGVFVAGGGVPEVAVGVRAELDHAEGGGGAGIGIAFALGADEGADVIGEMGLGAAELRSGRAARSRHGNGGQRRSRAESPSRRSNVKTRFCSHRLGVQRCVKAPPRRLAMSMRSGRAHANRRDAMSAERRERQRGLRVLIFR